MTASNAANSEVRNDASTDFNESLASTASSINAPSSSTLSCNTEQVKLLKKRSQIEVECIDLDDDDDIVIEKVSINNSVPSSVKRMRLYDRLSSPVPEDPKTNSVFFNDKKSISNLINNSKEKTESTKTLKNSFNESHLTTKKEAEINSYSVLLDCLENYVITAINTNDNVERKILDVLLAAINIQVQKEPYSVRKLILEKQLVLPNTISFPPSQVVEVIIEHDADTQLSRVINKLFGDEKLKLTEAERKERQQLKNLYPAPFMTKLLIDIGQDLVQESTYSDIVHAKNLPEVPKNMETYNQVAAQLKPVWEALRAKNERFRLRVYTCQVCGFKTDNRTVLSIHRQTPHFFGRKYQCAMCPEFDTNEHRINRHYIEVHGLIPLPREEELSKIQCSICDKDFIYKGHRDSHLKLCKRDVNKFKTLQMSLSPEHICVINQWLWDKPPIEPSIIAQQQQAKQQQILLQQQRAITAATIQQNNLQKQQQLLNQRLKNSSNVNATINSVTNNVNRLQNLNNLIPQQQQQQLLKLLNNNGNQLTPQLLQAAMQLRQQQIKNLSNKSGAAQSNNQLFNFLNLPKQSSSSTSSSSSVQKTKTNQMNKILPLTNKNLSIESTNNNSSNSSSSTSIVTNLLQCEVCDSHMRDKENYLNHLQSNHKQLNGKTIVDMVQGPPLACSRCRDRFWTYEGLERHLVMVHGLVTSELLVKAQRKEDGGRCKLCGKQYAFNMLQHLVSDHKVKLCSAEIMYSCDVCSFRCSYQSLENHLSNVHPKVPNSVAR